MPPTRGTLALLICVVLALPGPLEAAGSVRLIAADERGITLRFELPEHRLEAGADGRSRLVVPGLQVMDVPGRAAIPFATALVALPPGAQAVATLLDGGAEDLRSDVRLAITGRPGFRPDERLGNVPVRDPVPALVDGPWPTSPVEVGQPFVLRRQRLVSVSFRPFRYDEADGRLWVRGAMTVRVDFAGATRAAPGAAREDAHWEPVLREAVINYAQGKAWREAPRRAGAAGSLFDRRVDLGRAAAFDEDYPEVRVRIDTSGVYSIPFEALADAGYPSGIAVDRVSVHRHEFVEDAVPPYRTIELAIEVDDSDNDTVFGPGDQIVTYVQNWAERSGASLPQRLWGDAEVVYVTAVAGSGKRPPQKPGWRNVAGLTPPASYPWSQRWEKNLAYNRYPPDTLTDQFHWTQNVSYYDRPALARIAINHVDASRPASFSISLAGRSRTDHVDYAELRNGGGQAFALLAPAPDSVVWSGFGTLNRSVVLPPGALTEGETNGLHLWGKNNRFAPPCVCNVSGTCSNCFDNIGLNHFDITYWRSYRALEYYLSFNSGDQQGEFQIRATGFFSPAIRVYDITDSLERVVLDPARIQPDGFDYAFDMQDSVATGGRRRYIACVFPRSLPEGAITPVTRRDLGMRGAGDYLLIVPEAFLPAMAPLVALRQSQNINVVVAPFESVCDEFNGGRRSKYAIQRFTRFAYEQWNAQWVLLVGDGSEDPQNFLGSSTDWIPVQKIIGPVIGDFGAEVVVSDPWYGCMGDCDLGTLAPVVPDLFVGRLPVQTLAQAQAVVDKIVAYENPSGDQSWRNQLLLSGDDDYSGISFFGGGGGGSNSGTQVCRAGGEMVFRQINQTIAEMVSDEAGLRRTRLDTFYLGDLLGRAACLDPGDPCQCRDLNAVRAFTRGGPTLQLLSRLSAGCLWWNYQGHANEFVLSHEDLYRNDARDDVNDLFNDGKPFLFSAFSCHANTFARAGDVDAGGSSLGEDMVLRARAGAIASWASSGFESLPISSTSHINVSLAEAMFLNPPLDDYFDGRGARVLLGEAIQLALTRYVPGVVFYTSEKGIGLTYNLLGDPATRMSLGAPQTIVTANGDTVISDRPVTLAPPRDTLKLEADLVSNARIDTILVIENSARVLPPDEYTLTPSFPDTGVGNRGGRRYHLSFTTPVRPGLLRYTLRVVDRYGLTSDFNVLLQFFTELRVGDNRLVENDPVLPAADLALIVKVPAPVTDAQAAFQLKVDAIPQEFTATPLEATGREWRLDWTHAPYAIGSHTVEVTAMDSLKQSHTFKVVDQAGAGNRLLRDAVAFPNPFDEQVGTSFSFYLLADGPGDVMLRLFTLSGRTIYQREARGLSPGYHQWTWDGRDAEGAHLANGVYLYTLVCTAGSRTDGIDGRIVKLRRPRRGDTPP